MTIADRIADNIHRDKCFPIMFPGNVSQVGRDTRWVAALPDNSVLWCDYEKQTTKTFVVPENEHPVDFMNGVLV